MAEKPQISNWDEANTYLNAGRNKTERPLWSSWRICRLSSGSIGIYDKKKGVDQCYVIYHADGSVELDYHHYWIDNRTSSIMLEYCGVDGFNTTEWQRTFYLPSFGNTPADVQQCNRCAGKKTVETSCGGPGWCEEALNFPKHLRDTGAPNAHCRHYETDKHPLDCCEHGETKTHMYDVRCPYCNGAGVADYGSKPEWREWPRKDPNDTYSTMLPIRIKDGVLVVTP